MAAKVEYFDTKTIDALTSRGVEERTILMQNENGPCPLVALINTLVLSDKHGVADYLRGKERVSVKGLLELLGEQLFEQYTTNDDGSVVQEKKNVEEAVPAESSLGEGTSSQAPLNPSSNESPDSAEDRSGDAHETLKLLPNLVTGLSVNVRFDGTFEDTPEMALFRAYDVDIVHGWICDPEDPEYSTIAEIGSYDESQSIIVRDESEADSNLHSLAEAARHFISTNATQLTPYGLSFLRELLYSDCPAVLFRNDHFSTVVKHNETLYVLLSDHGYKDQKELVWQSLTDVRGAADGFYDASFMVPSTDKEEDDREFVDENRDYALARELQENEDAVYAAELEEQNVRRQEQSQSQSRQQASRSSDRAQPQKRSKSSKKSKTGKKKDCIIM
uniref:ARAD1D05786p n=1 Tax=Blastobotrys adeninivorans TaxID=409370 RepID=A0A060TDE2_BLAAD